MLSGIEIVRKEASAIFLEKPERLVGTVAQGSRYRIAQETLCLDRDIWGTHEELNRRNIMCRLNCQLFPLRVIFGKSICEIHGFIPPPAADVGTRLIGVLFFAFVIETVILHLFFSFNTHS